MRAGSPIVLQIYRAKNLNLYNKHQVAFKHFHNRPVLGHGHVPDNLLDGKRIRGLTIVDHIGREFMTIHVDQGIFGNHIVGVINAITFIN